MMMYMVQLHHLWTEFISPQQNTFFLIKVIPFKIMFLGFYTVSPANSLFEIW